MYEEIAKVALIFLLSMFKFIAGPTLGYAAGLSFLGSVILTVVSMMTSVLLFTYLGRILKEKVLSRFFKGRKKFTPRSRRFVRIWKKYGLVGVAFLTPLLLTPVGGTLLLTSFGAANIKIVFSMLVSAIFWAFLFCGAIYYFGPQILPGSIY